MMKCIVHILSYSFNSNVAAKNLLEKICVKIFVSLKVTLLGACYKQAMRTKLEPRPHHIIRD